MKRIFAFLVFLLVASGLMTVAAAEAAIVNMPVEQFDRLLPNGLILDQEERAPGKLTLVIDDDQTNWARAIANTGSAGDAQILWQIKTPQEVTVGDYVIVVRAEDEADALSTLKYCEEYGDYRKIDMIDSWQVACRGNGMPHTESGVSVARSIPEMSYLNPQSYQTTVYVGWYKDGANGTKELIDNCYQKLQIRFDHTRSSAFRTNVFNTVSKENIKPNYGQNNHVSLLSVEDGAVSYCIPEQGQMVQTGIRAPEGAVTYATQFNIKTNDPMFIQPLTEDGYALVNVHRFDREINSSAQTVFFYDENDTLIDERSIIISYQYAAEILPWFAFSREMKAVDPERVQIINEAEAAGFAMTYNAGSGHLEGAYSGQTGNSAPGAVKVKVTAPEGAAACRVHVAGSNYMYGPGAGSVAGLEYKLQMSYPQGPVTVSDGYVHTEIFEPFQKIQPQDDEITIYVPPFSANVPNMVEIYVYEWLDAWGDPVDFEHKYEYLWQTIENFSVAEKKIPVKQQKDLTEKVTQPEIVVPNGSPFKNNQLKLTAYYTEGTNTWLYDLTMLDAEGRETKPNTPVWVYLPYPEGHQTGTKYKLNHYTNGLYDGSNINSAEKLLIEETLYGLMFQTSSFSPFVLSIQETPQPTPTAEPTVTPTPEPTATPAVTPTAEPTPTPTLQPTATPTAEPTATPTSTPVAEAPTAVQSFAFTDDHISDELKAAGFKTKADVEIAIKSQLLSKGIHTANAKLYDVQLMYQKNGQWYKADGRHFPTDANGKPWLHVLMELPEGSAANDRFTVAHMFSSSAFGKVPGQLEYPAAEVVYVNGKTMLSFYVTGLSPVMIVWQKPAPVPQTGDSMPLVMSLLLLIASGVYLFKLSRRRTT